MTEEQQQRAFRSTLISKVKSRLTVNKFTQFLAWSRQEPKGSTVFNVTGLKKSHYFSLFLSSGILLLGFGSSIQVTLTRKDTFARSIPQIEQKFGKAHREAFGEDTKLNKLGWPDMGSGIYSDLLTYGDWIKINNAQRQHEFGYENMIVLLPNAFICALSFPRFTNFCLGSYFILRMIHINGYTDFRGHNKAMAAEEFMKTIMTLLIVGSLYSSLRLTRIP